MKKILFIVILFNFNFISAQNCTMQPALSESDKILDYVLIYKQVPDEDEYLDGRIQNITFDSDKNPTLYNYERYNENNDVISISRTTSTYYPLGESKNESFPRTFPTNEKYSEVFISNTNSWMPEYIAKYVKYEKYAYSGITENREYLSYDDDGNITYHSKKSTVTNDDLPIENTRFSWDSSNDTFSMQSKYILNNSFTNDVLSERIINKITDFNTNEEVPYHKDVFNDNTNSYEKTTYVWDGTNWDNLDFKQVTYVDNLITDVSVSHWNAVDANWELYYQSVFTYDQYGNMESFTYYYHNQLKYFQAFTYDLDNLLTQVLYNKYDTDTGDLLYTRRYEYFYIPESNLETQENIISEIKLYPNPVTKVLNINTDKEFNYTITSIQGEKVMQGTSYNSIDVQSLKNGLYFITLKIDNKQITKKIMVTH